MMEPYAIQPPPIQYPLKELIRVRRMMAAAEEYSRQYDIAKSIASLPAAEEGHYCQKIIRHCSKRLFDYDKYIYQHPGILQQVREAHLGER